MRLVFDVESTLIPKVAPFLPDTIHCMVVRDMDDDHEWTFGPDGIQGGHDGEVCDGVGLLMEPFVELLVGHNIAKFDIPLLEMHYLDFAKYRTRELYDTLYASRMIYASNMLERGIAFQRSAGTSIAAREAKLPSRLLKAHSLEAWGYRMKIPKLVEKIENKEDFFAAFSADMLEYNQRDVELNVALAHYLLSTGGDHDWPPCSLASLINESKFAYILGVQERNGVRLDEGATAVLYSNLAGRKAALASSLKAQVDPWYAPAAAQCGTDKALTDTIGCARHTECNRDRVLRKGLTVPMVFTKGASYTKISLVEFNPGSGPQISLVLQRDFGWEPEEHTTTGRAKVDEKTIAGLEYPIIKDLCLYLMVAKRMGQIGDGPKAWLKVVNDEGLIHGLVNPSGTRTSRCSHQRPNLAQVPKVGKPYGAECRACFGPTREGWVQVGCDASGLELRMLAHRMAKYDDGAFGAIVTDGDIHSTWMKLTKLFIRDNQKTFTYALLYGAGDKKLGEIILKDWREAYEKKLTTDKPKGPRFAGPLGNASRSSLLRGLPALDLVLDNCKCAFKRGRITALDGRVLACPTEHGALNDVLQSDGAIVMKHAAVIREELFAEAGFVVGEDWAPLLNIHDEWEDECACELTAHCIGGIGRDAIIQAGEKLGLRVPLDAEYTVGKNWAACH